MVQTMPAPPENTNAPPMANKATNSEKKQAITAMTTPNRADIRGSPIGIARIARMITKVIFPDFASNFGGKSFLGRPVPCLRKNPRHCYC